MKLKSKKSALLLSFTSLLLCFAMLAGSTFAWFTDTATTGVNKIVSGNLDIEAYYRTAADGAWAKIDDKTDLFGTASTRFEPGHTRVVELKIENAGNLALKYKIGMNIASETPGTNKAGNPYKLSDSLKVATTAILACNTGNPTTDATAEWFDEAVFEKNFSLWKNEQNLGNFELEKTESGTVNQLLPGGEVILGMKIYMPDTVGNEANALTTAQAASITFGLNILATQYIYERDSFSNNYDEDATYPVASSESLADAIANAEDGSTVDIASGEYTLSGTGVSAGVTISGAGADKTVLKTDSKNYEFTGDNVTIKDVTIDGTENSAFDDNGVIKIMGSNAVLDSAKLIGGGQNTYGHTARVDMEADSITTIKNSTISGAFRAIQSFELNGTLLIENSTLAPQCYCLNVDAGSGKLVVKNSVLKGWTSYTDTVESATFTDCTFEKNSDAGSYGYNCVRGYTDTTFVNCDFGDGFWFGAANRVVTVTFENCRYKGTLITESNVNEILESTDNNATTVVVK